MKHWNRFMEKTAKLVFCGSAVPTLWIPRSSKQACCVELANKHYELHAVFGADVVL